MDVQKVVSWIDTSLTSGQGKKGKLSEYHLPYLHKGNEGNIVQRQYVYIYV